MQPNTDLQGKEHFGGEAMPERDNTLDTGPVSDAGSVRKTALLWVLTIAASLCVYGIVAALAVLIFPPDMAALEQAAADVLIEPRFSNPEPVEVLLFRLAVVVIPAGLFVFYGIFNRWKRVRDRSSGQYFSIIITVITVLLAAIIVAVFAVPNVYPLFGWHSGSGITEVSNFGYYFTGCFMGSFWWLYVFLAVPGLVYVFLEGYRKHKLWERRGFTMGARVAGYTLGGLVLLSLLVMNAFDYPYSAENKYNFNAVYYSMTQVYAGIPLLVKGFTNTYGLYPHFLNLLFQVTGLSVAKFSGVMSVMLVGAFVMNYLVLRKLVKDELLRFLGFFTLLFFSYFVHKLAGNFDCIFSLFPIRYIIPSTLSIAACVYTVKPSVKMYRVISVFTTVSVLWNPEMGLVCYVSWFAMNMYMDMYGRHGAVAWRRIARHAGAMVLMLPAAALLWKGIIYVSYGAAPDMNLLWSAMVVFGRLGFNMLPMAPAHPWVLVALIVIAGLVYSLPALHRRAQRPRDAMVFLLSLVSLGYLLYFQGRSHSDVLSLSSGFAIILLTLLADDLLAVVRTHMLQPMVALFAVVIALLGFGIIELPYNSLRIAQMMTQTEEQEKQAEQQKDFEANRKFFLENTMVRDKVLVLCKPELQSLYFDGSKRRSAFNPGFIELFTKKDEQRLFATVLDSPYSIFMEPQGFDDPGYQPVSARVAATRQLFNNTGTMVQFRQRAERVPAASFFKDGTGQLLYRKYTDDTAGWNQRVADALRNDELNLPPVFSVQCLFYTSPQPYPSAALVSNRVSDRGFAIYNEFNTEDYVFVINNSGVRIVTPLNQWVYFAMNVFPDHFEVYKNGEFKASKPITKLLQNSGDAFRIGNLSGMAYYVGAIAEVAVNNVTLDSTVIRDTWQIVKSKN